MARRRKCENDPRRQVLTARAPSWLLIIVDSEAQLGRSREAAAARSHGLESDSNRHAWGCRAGSVAACAAATRGSG
eukprot:1807063-Rhodomonas_salina.1